MTAPAVATPGVPTSPGGPAGDGTVGDGTTARSRAASRWRRWRFLLGLLGVLAVVGLLVVLPAPRTSLDPLAPDGTGPTGSRAAAQILGRQGVDVVEVTSVARLQALAGPGTTVLVAGEPWMLDEDQLATVRDLPADLVLVDAGWSVSTFTDAVSGGSIPVPDPPARAARCDDPDARAAGSITARGTLVASSPSATVCFPDADPAGGGAYAVVTEDDRRITVLADSTPMQNAHLAQEGNAALVLRMLGRHETLLWFVPTLSSASAGDDAGPGTLDLLPPAARVAGLQLLLVVLVAAVWQGRRLGPLVTEALPVVVRAGETTRGRGRLYRRSRAHGHAAAGLRA
ncbi:DUF4350 domain-containing protein, partial [Cellulomonas massiliensis]|uniref:DUF4350 domain-containing protein n=1 Tax=Cellulomonas massiliensis TaxID=1465811 RepID=UPI0003690EE7